jgi:hypothetical protein
MAEVGYQNNADNRNRTDNARNAFCADNCAKKSDFKSLGVRHDVVLHLKNAANADSAHQDDFIGCIFVIPDNSTEWKNES